MNKQRKLVIKTIRLESGDLNTAGSIVSIGDEYVVSAFGEAANIENFKTKVSDSYPMSQVLYEENLAQ